VGEWRRLRIGDVCDIVKGETGLASATPGQYPMVATGAERRSCNTYQFDTEAVCIPLVSSTGHGKKTLNYVHFQSGKFALGTILAAVIPKDSKVLTARYLHLYLSHFKDTVLVPLMKGAANVSLPMKGIASVEIPVPSVVEQQKLIDLIGCIESEHRELLEEGNHQAGLFKQLHQAVLQEAVEGKLTADWRKQHPLVKGDPQHDAATLLDCIRERRNTWIMQNKIIGYSEASIIERKIDAVLQDNPNKLAGLPDGWESVYLIDAVNLVVDCHNKTAPYSDSGIKLLRTTNIRDRKIDLLDTKFITEKTYSVWAKRCQPEPGDIIFTREAPLGEAGIIPVGALVCMGQRLMLIRAFNDLVPNRFLLYVLTSSAFLERLHKASKGAFVKHLRVGDVESAIIPLPPLAEQQAIVARVDSLMATIDALEAQVTERKEQAQLLMQAVLREAFAGGEADET